MKQDSHDPKTADKNTNETLKWYQVPQTTLDNHRKFFKYITLEMKTTNIKF